MKRRKCFLVEHEDESPCSTGRRVLTRRHVLEFNRKTRLLVEHLVLLLNRETGLPVAQDGVSSRSTTRGRVFGSSKETRLRVEP